MTSDLTGKTFGEWTVLHPSKEKRYHYTCKCSCGVIRDVYQSALRRGKSLSCGHDKAKRVTERGYKRTDEQVLGQTFGRLTPIERVNNQGRARYLCNCACGNQIEVLGTYLLSGHSASCGCLKSENSKRLMTEIMEEGHEKSKSMHVEGTAIYNLDEKLSKNSTTGVKGVSKIEEGRYRAYITVKRKHIHLGVFPTLEEAQEARLEAEEKYFKPIQDRYKNSPTPE